MHCCLSGPVTLFGGNAGPDPESLVEPLRRISLVARSHSYHEHQNGAVSKQARGDLTGTWVD
jgi:hypothetical protein